MVPLHKMIGRSNKKRDTYTSLQPRKTHSSIDYGSNYQIMARKESNAESL